MLHEEFGKVKPDEFKIIVRSDLQKANLKLDNLALNETINDTIVNQGKLIGEILPNFLSKFAILDIEKISNKEELVSDYFSLYHQIWRKHYKNL